MWDPHSSLGEAVRSWVHGARRCPKAGAGGCPYQRLLVPQLRVHGAAAAAPGVQEAMGRVQVWGALGGGHGRGRCAHDDWRGQAAPALQVPVGGHGQGVHLHLWRGGGFSGRGSCPPGLAPGEPHLCQVRRGTALPPSPPHTCGPEVSELVEILFQVSGRLVLVCVRPVGVALCPQSRGSCEVPLGWEPSVPSTPPPHHVQ